MIFGIILTGVGDESFPGNIPQPDLEGSDKRMRRMCRDTDREAPQRFEVNSAHLLFRRPYHEGDLQFAVAQSTYHLPGGSIVKMNPNSGTTLMELAQCAGKQIDREGRSETNVDLSQFSHRNSTRHLHRFVGPLQ